MLALTKRHASAGVLLPNRSLIHMIRTSRTLAVTRLLATISLLFALSACTTIPSGGAALVAGQEATLEGQVVAVDTAPWAYDGNAIITLSTDAGRVAVQLPARWNLCKAPPPDDVQSLKAGDRVQVVGEVTAPGEVMVCAKPQHRLGRLD